MISDWTRVYTHEVEVDILSTHPSHRNSTHFCPLHAMPELHAELLAGIRLRHVMQLADMEIPPAHELRSEAPSEDVQVNTVTGWIEANQGAIKAAQASQCSSPSPVTPSWDSVFYSFIESAAMFLRKPDEMVETIKAAREGDFVKALKHLALAQEDIDSVAKALDCTFVQLCDFSNQTPEGTTLHSGAFCGLFISNSIEKPFMGVAFKGTSKLSEIITDLNWRPTEPEHGIAFGAKVHFGFYQGLFGRYKVGSGFEVPFDTLVYQLTASYHSSAKLHFTGYSLGGAYCALTYGEFLRRQDEAAFRKFNFGDLYCLGAPRTCLPPFAEEVNRRTTYGTGRYVFRVFNKNDPVPTVPPVFVSQLPQYPFTHVGGAWQLSEEGPDKLQDEPPQMDPQGLRIFANWKYHASTNFYANWQKTNHS